MTEETEVTRETRETRAAGTVGAAGAAGAAGGSGAGSLLQLVPRAEGKQSMKDFKSDQEVRWCPGCGD
ncbi:hypothetical protein ACFUIW_39410, partial [Streptomyces sp. NPDC057245]